jgi:hypothetical protein
MIQGKETPFIIRRAERKEDQPVDPALTSDASGTVSETIAGGEFSLEGSVAAISTD